MKKLFTNSDSILAFAISLEQESALFYYKLSNLLTNAKSRNIILSISNDENKHKERLLNIQQSGQFYLDEKKINLFNKEDFFVDISKVEDLSIKDMFLLAMKKEKVAFKLYSTLSAKVDDQLLKLLFETMAQEESKHKLRFEFEYDEVVKKEN